MKKDIILKILRIVSTMFAAALLALATLAVFYVIFWVLKMISAGVLKVCDFMITAIIANWASSRGLLVMMTIGVLELELLVKPRFQHRKDSKDTSSSSESDENSEENSDDIMEYYKDFFSPEED